MTAVIRGGAADLDELSHVIADAFFDLPPSRWLISDPEDRRKMFPAYFRLVLEHALACGVIHTTTARAAAALWLPATSGPLVQPAGYHARLTAVTWPWTDRFVAFDNALERHHPAGTPHHHLAILAVRPGLQGRGTGTALLDYYHHQLDLTGEAAYLEAATEANRDFYLRHGYVLRPDAPFDLPDGGPPMSPMWREPRPGARS